MQGETSESSDLDALTLGECVTHKIKKVLYCKLDVFRRQVTADGPFELLKQVGSTSTSDPDTITEVAYYLIGARNACGSSGEEPF